MVGSLVRSEGSVGRTELKLESYHVINEDRRLQNVLENYVAASGVKVCFSVCIYVPLDDGVRL